MRANLLTMIQHAARAAVTVLLLAGGFASADTINLSAGSSTTTLPDGQVVPMWGYTCGAIDSSSAATCAAANPNAGTNWSPVVITVPQGTPLTINLTNNLPAGIPTSLVIDGQLGGGLGAAPQRMPSPPHAPQGTTWPGTLGGVDPATAAITVGIAGAGYVMPPAVTISGGGGSGAVAVATIANGMVTGVIVSGVGSGYTSTPTVTIAPPPCTINGTTCVGATATMDLSVLQSSDGSATFVPPPQPDRVRSFATEVPAGGTMTLPDWSNLRPGTYLIHSGTHPSIQHPMGLYGVLVVTEQSNTQAYGTFFDKDLALLLSEIDPEQNRAVDLAVNTTGFDPALVWDGQTGKCGDPAVHTCYPPAVNYSPMYYLINGVAFDRTNPVPAASPLTVSAAGATGKVLLRFVNAGLRMHVPSVVNQSLTLLAEDGNKLPGLARVQNSVFLAAGKTYEVTIQPVQGTSGTYDNATLAVYDRQLSLSTGNQRDGGMQAYITVGTGAAAGSVGSSASATALSASDKTYYCSAGATLSITDPALGLLAGTVGANGLRLGTTFTGDTTTATVTLKSNGTFTYVPTPVPTPTSCGGTFNFVVNGTATKTATIAQCDVNSSSATGCTLAAGPSASNVQFVSNVNTRFASPPPGVMTGVTNPGGLALKATGAGINADGSFVATGPGTSADCNLFTGTLPAGATCVKLPYTVANLQGKTSSATATVAFLPASNLAVNVWDAPSTAVGKTKAAISDYRWIIEEDKTFWIDPKCQVNVTPRPLDSNGHTCPPLPVESLGYNFHTANMPVVAQGCVGTVSCEGGQTINGGTATACDIGNGVCPTDGVKSQKEPLLPGTVHLDPNKRYFISILPGDGVNPTVGGAGGPDANGKPFDIKTACGDYTGPTGAWEPAGAGALCGHAMGGTQIAAGQTAVDIALQQTPLPTAKISVFVFQDDNPLNGENDAGGGVDVLAPNEPGLGGFEIKLFDQAGGLGDATGQITYDMFNQPVSNALANKIDPVTGLDSCPINSRGDGLVGMIPTCPKYESDGKTVSPLAGQVVIANLYPGLYEIQAYPAADRIARGEEWLQTNTLDGGKPHEAFIKPNEPGYFQEFGPGGFHVAIGFANQAIINARKAGYCNSPINANQPCTNTLNVQVTNNHMSRTPDQRTFDSETYDQYSFTQCYVSIGPADAEDFALEKCGPDGKVSFTNMPPGVFKLTVFDQWNDIMLDGLVGTVSVAGGTTGGSTTDKVFPVGQWRTNLFTRTFIDNDGDGTSSHDLTGTPCPNPQTTPPTACNPNYGSDTEAGLALVNTNIHYRDGSVGFFNNTDLNGYAGFNEVFPFMNWLVVDTSSTRFKPTGVHTVYDAGGPVDCSVQVGPGGPCSTIAANLANTDVRVKLPSDLRAPGAKYCDQADCLPSDLGGGASTGTVFPPQPWGTSQGWQGMLGQNSFMEFGVKPYIQGENGGISGMVIYASTRPFDDPSLSLQLSWEPGVPRVKINLYSKTVDASGNEVLKLVDTTMSASWDDWAQGFRRDANGALMQKADGSYIPNMNCPGQDSTSPFFATLKNSKEWLDDPANKKALAYQSQFKCYDGWSQLNQIQPAPYDGLYKFPSVVTTYDKDTTINNVTHKAGQPATTNCTGCITNPDDGNPMLPAGKYVVEVIVPPGFELVKEEDKNILLGDVYIAPVSQQFAGFGNIFIMPDQAAVNAAYNPNSTGGLNKTTDLGAAPHHEGDTGSVESFWPCVGAERIIPDLNSLYPGAGQAAPFAGAKRHLCDRKEVTLEDESSSLAKFFIFSSTHIAGHFTGNITNDFAAEFDPFSPQFGEKFGPPNLPVGMRDFSGNEVARVYADQWGVYNGLFFSTYGVNPPNPTGYVPQMSIACMNDPGPIPDPAHPGQMITDPNYNPAYSNFCYETPFMPGFTAYMDTPVIPTQSFADSYNLPDSEYPDGTPAISTVTSSAIAGPWVHSATTNHAASATVSFSAVSSGNSVTSVQAGSTTLTTATITCNAASACSNLTSTGRNNRMAQLVAQNIAAHSGVSGFTATSSSATVTITATASGVGPNGTAVSVNQTGITVTGTQLFAGGSTASPASMGLTITSLGDKVVQNPNYSGPNASTAPYNQKTITRHYGFGGPAGTVAVVGSDAVSRPLTGVTWSDTTITGTVPSGLPNCAVQQRGQPATQCGELVITRGDNGKQSIDAITVTVGGSAPWIVSTADVTAPAGKTKKDYTANFGRMGFSPIQTAIDSADPGDLIIVSPGTYRENLVMWKPVRLQGVGASSVTINADAHPAGKLDQWRRQVDCAFGLTLDGIPNLNNSGFQGTDPNNSSYLCPDEMHQRVDRIPFEAIVGWDASGNGNLAQVLQEPTLMGAYEGAGITVLGRGVRIPDNSTDFWGVNATGGAGAFTDGSVYLGSGNADCTTRSDANGRDYGTSNFFCNPSRIDGVSIINSSQGGGGVFIHGWSHYLDVANTRIWGNHGTLAGAINLGNGETPDAFVNDGVECGVTPAVMPCPPTSWNGYTPPTNAAIPFQFNTKVRIHHNMLYNNASTGDALFSGTPAGAGGITISEGADGYQIDHNWIAGNLSTGDGGGLQHLGLSFQGKIDHNFIVYNQSTNPTLPTSGGGVVIEGANLDRTLNGTECGSTSDQDCPPGLAEGTGFGLVIDANLILGNSAESGSGGGLRLQQVNGSEMTTFPRLSSQWYDVTVTNNIIANNVAGWDGGGVSTQDALKVTFVNNTVASNDTTASAGVLFKTLGAINASSPPPGCTPTTDPTQPQSPNCTGADAPHGPQPAGLVAQAHTPNLVDAINGVTPVLGVRVLCPTAYGYTGTLGANGDCMKLSKPRMVNDLFWQNRSFRVDLAGSGTGLQSQQNLVTLSPALTQTITGQCVSGANYWDIGLRTDDLTANTIPAGTRLALTNSIYTGDAGTTGVITASVTNRVGPFGTPPVVAQFCNGARMPPEHCADAGIDQNSLACSGYNAPPGASETTSTPVRFVFNGIQPTATVDEGHNWLNLSFGPLQLGRPKATTPTAGEQLVLRNATGSTFGAYAIPSNSSAVGGGSAGTGVSQVATDFFGTARSGRIDIGAAQYASAGTPALVSPGSLTFGPQVVGTTSATQTLTLAAGGSALTGITVAVTSPFARAGGSCGATLAANGTCSITVSFTPSAASPATGTVTITSNVPVTNSPVALTGTGIAATFTASITPTPLAFGNWAAGTTSSAKALTLTNTGNSALSGLAFAFGGGTPQPFSRTGGSCGTTLAVGASCTVNVVFAPATAVSFSRTLTVTGNNGLVTTNSPVTLTGTGVATRATVSISPNPLTITIATPLGNAGSGTGTVTLTNTAPVGTGAQMTVSNVAVASGTGSGLATWFFNAVGGAADTCTGATLAPGASCTVDVRFTNVFSAVSTNRPGTITFTDNASSAPQSGSLIGFANP